ncbi:MAG TPA: S8 family serine peptidase [Jiangellaceae bacterium]
MSIINMSRRRTRLIATTAAVGLTAATALAAGGPALAAPHARPTQTDFRSGNYVVVLAEQPAATYDGGVHGLAATAPAEGERLKPASDAVRDYQAHLERRQEQVAASVGAELGYQYTVALNAFSAELSADQAAKLDTTPGVLAVVEDVPRTLDTVKSPEFLGLSGDDGLWDQLGGPDSAGHGVVVGVIDSGIWPENASFAGDPLTGEPSTAVGVPYRTSDTGTAMVKANGDTFTGECQPGEEWTAELCTSKLVSARYFADGFLTNVPEDHRSEFEHISTRDGDGHGSHTAGTAAGNDGVPMSVNDREFGEGSGMAPAAKIAAYKVCWEDDDPNTGGCYLSDIAKAIDQAVIDNVDVINFSISGSLDTLMDPTELAFLSAASAGIFVAASAGNSGPAPSTVAHNSPWLTTVAASTHVNYEGTVVLGDGRRFRGSMLDDQGVSAQTPLVYAGDIALEGADPADAALCGPDTLDPALATGSIVICDRGVYDRVAKSTEAGRAGGVGVVLANVAPGQSLDADFHSLPTTHVDAAAAEAIRAYAGVSPAPSGEPDLVAPRTEHVSLGGPARIFTPTKPGTDPAEPGDGPTAALLPGDQSGKPATPVPVIAGFSSRGPALANDGDLLKPDISAPGVSVLAPVVPGPNGGNDYGILSGTSMASPHVAGLAALIRGAEPQWSPMAVKSAMMTTAYDLRTPDRKADTNRFNAGAGHVDPSRFLSPGLVYESTHEDWLAFLEGTGEDLGIPGLEPIDPSNLNQPSIAVGALAGSQQITRSVTAVTPGLYVAKIDVPGFTAKVSPPVLNFTAAGQTKPFTVTLTRAKAPLDTYAQGTLTWRGGGTTVRSPIVVKPVAVAAPTEVSGTGADGEVSYDVVPGSSGDIDLELRGLTPGEVTPGSLTPGEAPDPGGNASSQLVEFDLPEGTSLARFDLLSGADDADYDLYVFGPDGAQLPVNGATGSASERVDLADPEAGTYFALVHMFASADGSAVDFSMRNFAIGADAAGNATVSPDPAPATIGKPSEVTVAWSGLDADVPYLGAISYAGTTSTTVVTIE